jgi:hypothetical protein
MVVREAREFRRRPNSMDLVQEQNALQVRYIIFFLL